MASTKAVTAQAPQAPQAQAQAQAPQVSGTLFYRRQHPGGGPLGRCSYGVPGVPGIVVFDMGLFAGGIAPATVTVNCALAAPQPRKVAGVTSAVVAQANTAQAQAQGTAIAAPAAVAGTTAAVAGKLVRKAQRKAAPALT